MSSQQINKLFLSSYKHTNIPNDYVLTLFADIEKVAENSIDEIFIRDGLGSCSDQELSRFLLLVIEKLKNCGYLNIQDIDFEQFCLYVYTKILPVDSKNLLYKNRITIYTLADVVREIKKIPHITISQTNFINGYEFFMRIKKND